MARIITDGFEDRAKLPALGPHLSLTPSANTTYPTTGQRSGEACLRSANDSYMQGFSILGASPVVDTTVLFGRFWFACEAFSTGQPVNLGGFGFSTSAGRQVLTRVGVGTTGDFLVHNNTTQLASVAGAISADGSWHSVEIRLKINTGSTDELRVLLDGVEVYSATNLAIAEAYGQASLQIGSFLVGLGTQASSNPTNYGTFRFDDVAVNDQTGTNENSYPPREGKVVSLYPISDNSRVNWLGGAGGTTNLYDAVNNRPPIGTATETDLTQIEELGGSNPPGDYRANLETYTSKGIAAGDTIVCVMPRVIHGEDVTTGTKTLSHEVMSNPAVANSGNYNAGNDGSALGTYPTLWYLNEGPVVYNPSVTLGTSPVMRVYRALSGSETRVVSVCSMSLIVEYTVISATNYNVPAGAIAMGGAIAAPAANAASALGAITFGGQVPSLTSTQAYNVPVGSMAFGGLIATPSALAQSALGAIAFGGLTPSQTRDYIAAIGAIAFGGLTPEQTRNYLSAIGAIALAGQVPSQSLSAPIPLGSLAFTGQIPLAGVAYDVPTAALALNGLIPAASGQALAPNGAIAFGGLAPSYGQLFSIPAGALAFTGLAASPSAMAQSALGSLAFGGLAAIPMAIAQAPNGAITFVGLIPAIGSPSQSFGVPAGALIFGGAIPGPRGQAASAAGSLSFGGAIPSAAAQYLSALGALNLTGRVATPNASALAALGALLLTGQVPTLVQPHTDYAIPAGLLTLGSMAPLAGALAAIPAGAIDLTGLTPILDIGGLKVFLADGLFIVKSFASEEMGVAVDFGSRPMRLATDFESEE